MASNLGYKSILSYSAKATEALEEYRGVNIDFSADTATASYPATLGDLTNGVVLVNASVDENVQVIMQGIVPVKIKTVATISAGDLLTVDTDGQFVLATTGNYAIAQALVTPSADGDIVNALLIRPTIV